MATDDELVTDDIPVTDTDRVLASAEVQLGGFDPWATGRALRMSDRAIKFGMALLTGATQTASAKLAGLPGEGNALRSRASKMAKTRQMQAFLKSAKDHRAGEQDAPLSEKEKLRILAKGARGENPNIQIRATLAHHEIEQDMSQSRAGDVTPDQALMDLAGVNPLIAAEIAMANNLTLKNVPPDVLAQAARHVEQLAKGWIRRHAREAKDFAEYFLRAVPPQTPIITNGRGNH